MKRKALKISLLILGILLVFALAFYLYYLIITAGVNLDKTKLVDMDSSVEIYDDKGNALEEWSGGKCVTDTVDIPDYTLNAFVAIEDKRFYSHNGTDFKGFLRATVNNIKSFSLKEGASTITQQLIKNTHLSSEKTLKRKLSEIKLAKQLEKEYTKKEILEMYVNTIYFGDGCYGITRAANNYFGVSPAELSVNQSAALAGIIKAPATYSPKISHDKCNERKNVVLKEMLEQNFISQKEYDENIKKDITTVNINADFNSPYLNIVKSKIGDFLESTAKYGQKLKVYTYYDDNFQRILESSADNSDCDTDKKAIILDGNNKIKAFYSTCGDIKRQMGSTIKPLAVYAPAIEMGAIDSCTLINDEAICINGYTPKNYKNLYYGYVSAKFALAKSLNSCAVKILNECGADNSISFLRKTDIEVTESDKALCLALGVTEKGATLTEIAGAYGSFINKGLYLSPQVIKEIRTENGELLYKDTETPVRIYGEDTAFIVNDMLKSTVETGTAKKLAPLNIPLSAKTGTVGTENGNTDAYTISYNGDYVVASWVGNADSSFMQNSVSGGTVPAKICYDVWNNMLEYGYHAHDTFTTDKVAKIALDKISYEKNKIVEIADDNAPERFVLSEYFKLDRIPKVKSERFSSPKIENAEISVNYNGIKIQLCVPEYCEFKILRESNGLKTSVFDSAGKSNKTEFTDEFILPNTEYKYSIIPYINGVNGVKYGEEYFLNEIKTPPLNSLGDDLWKDFDLLFN